MSETIKGNIKKVTKFEGGRYSYRLSDENYYSGFGEPEFNEGEFVNVEYRNNVGADGKVYRNIVRVTREGNQPAQSRAVLSPQEIEDAITDLKLRVATAHKYAYDTAKAIIGREPTGDEFSFVNSIVLNYLKGIYAIQYNRN